MLALARLRVEFRWLAIVSGSLHCRPTMRSMLGGLALSFIDALDDLGALEKDDVAGQDELGFAKACQVFC